MKEELMARPVRIRIEHMMNPIGIDCNDIKVSWNVEGVKTQSAYRIIAEGNLGTKYDSGQVQSACMYNRIPIAFKSREQVQVQVEIEGNSSEKKYQSGTAEFEMGLLSATDWKAKWINPELSMMDHLEEESYRPASYLQKRFYVETGKVARLYATAHGVYTIYINGRKVEGFIMAPGVSEYHSCLQYQTYDIIDYLHDGENEIVVILGNGWWRGTTTYDGLKNGFGAGVALLAQIEIDGKVICSTDCSWRATQDGPLRHTDNMMGEVYDASYEKNLQKTDYWHAVQVEDFSYDSLVCSNCPPPVEQETFIASLLTSPKGEAILDFGQNIAGYISFEIEAKEGDIIRLTHAETLDGEGNLCMNNFQSPHFWCAQEIVYYCKEGKNYYKPSHTFMGFRYVKVEGINKIYSEQFKAFAVYTDLEVTASFRCGNEMVNRLFMNALWSIKGNLLDIPTDCPTREKSAFTGDLVTYAHTFMYLMDAYPIMQKFIYNQAVGQFEDGCVKQIIADPRERGCFDGAAGWSDSYEIIPDLLSRRYHDNQLFETYYEKIKSWIDYCITRAKKDTQESNRDNPYHEYLSDVGMHWGEWAEPGMEFRSYLADIAKNGEPEVATAYLFHACKLLSKQAEKLKRDQDKKYYESIAELVKKAYRYAYVHNGRIDSVRMCRYIRPIVFNLLTTKEKEEAAKQLNQLVIQSSYHLNTGFLTTHELCRTLSDHGYEETAYRLLLNRNSPGWLYAVEKGATTIPENWLAYQEDGSRKDSFNHYSYGAIAGWLMDSVAGIRVENGEITIRPLPYQELEYAEGSYLSPYGKIVSKWEFIQGKITYDFEIPCNCCAIVHLLDGRSIRIEAGKHSFEVYT